MFLLATFKERCWKLFLRFVDTRHFWPTTSNFWQWN